MANYTFDKQEKVVFTARLTTEKKLIEYEFERKTNGWYVKRWYAEADTNIPQMSEIFLPIEIVEQILLIESTKDKLKK